MPWTLLSRPGLLLKARHKNTCLFSTTFVTHLESSWVLFLSSLSYPCIYGSVKLWLHTWRLWAEHWNKLSTYIQNDLLWPWVFISLFNKFWIEQLLLLTSPVGFLGESRIFFLKSCVCNFGTSNLLFSKIQLCSLPDKPKLKVRGLLF